MSEHQSDPRMRPPDPAGTQPKVDPESLRAQVDGAQLTLTDGARRTPALTAGHINVTSGDAQDDAPVHENPTLDASALDAAAPTTDVVRPSSAQPPAPARSAAGITRNTPRFQFLFGALGAVAVAAIALAIALLRAPAPAPERPWSGWKPAADGVDPAQQIAAYVAPQYRLDDGKQIVQVSGGPPTLKGQPLTVGVIRSGQTPAALEGNSVLYQLCGEGADCSIKSGKPSNERGLLIAREGLELALYTFRYISGASQVVVTIPPPPPSSIKSSSATKTETVHVDVNSDGTSNSTSSASAKTVNHALLFTRADLAAPLEQPLSTTLSTVTPRVSQMNHWPDASAVKALTEPHLYDFTVSETQQAGAVMLLEPPSLSG